MIFERDPHRLFGVPRAHALTLVGRTERERAGRVREVRWFAETDPVGRPIARYRCWDERVRARASGAPASARRAAGGPYRELGWERYGPDGDLLDREVRRAPHPRDADPVH